MQQAMSAKRVLLVVATLGLAGCLRPALNTGCQFPFDDAPVNVVAGSVDQRALDNEALLAEDLAIRFADRTAGSRSKWPRGRDGYRATREQCMATLFAIVGRRHGVSPERVREAASHRAWSFDALTMGSLAVLYALVASRVIRRIVGGSLGTSAWASTFALAGASLALAIVGFGAGNVWSGIAEAIRLGNGHASYRALRIPWRQHPVPMFVACLVLFWLVAAYHSWNDGIRRRTLRRA
jgi:hypothetical protein